VNFDWFAVAVIKGGGLKVKKSGIPGGMWSISLGHSRNKSIYKPPERQWFRTGEFMPFPLQNIVTFIYAYAFLHNSKK
jgi:hypothetical protein